MLIKGEIVLKFCVCITSRCSYFSMSVQKVAKRNAENSGSNKRQQNYRSCPF